MAEIITHDPAPHQPSACPDPAVWISVCAGQRPSDQAERLLAHASECAACTMALGRAVAILREEPTADEQNLLDRLASNRSTWQGQVARRMETAARAPDLRAKVARRRFAWLLWPACAGACAAATVAIWIYRENHSVGHLLALAYDQKRLTELRLPGGRPVKMWSPPRGSVSGGEPIELAEARHQVELALQKNPEDAALHQELGEVEVVSLRPADALTELQKAQLYNATLPRLEFDLGTAYFEQAEIQGARASYADAIEHFDAQIAKTHGHDPVALFDEALCWQRTGVPELAWRDLTEALKSEKDPAWRTVIESQLRSLPTPAQPGKSGKSEPQNGGYPVHSPDYEAQLATLIEQDFGRGVQPDDPSVVEVVELARIHRDRWLSDWIVASQRHPSPRADAAVSAAARADAVGRSEDALPLAAQAADLYHVADNVPGELRADAEEIYALRRSGHPDACLRRLRALPSDQRLSSYPWLAAFLILERSSCLSQMGHFDEAREASQKALSIATSAQLPGIAIRARGYAAGFSTSQGLAAEAWRLNVLGLEATPPPDAGSMHRYQFVSDLSLDASLLDLPLTATSLASLSAQLAAGTGNQQVAAYAAEMEGRDEDDAGYYSLAGQAFQRADAILATLPQGSTTALYRADWAPDRAELQMNEGRGDEADATLRSVLPDIQGSGNFWIAFKYWTRRARIDSLTHLELEALASSAKAVACAESALRGMTTVDERQAWERRAESAWTSLIDSELNSGRNDEALGEWLWFRSVPEAPDAPDDPPGTIHSAREARELAHSRWPDSMTVVFIRLPRRYQVFALLPQGKEVLTASVDAEPVKLDQLIRSFSTLCADPNSSPAEVEAIGHRLYDLLISPVMRQPVAELRIDAPAALDGLPFAALVAPDGSVLGSRTRVVSLPTWWSHSTPFPSRGSSSTRRLFLVDASIGSAAGPRIPFEYDEAPQLATMFRNTDILAHSAAGIDEVVGRLRRATVFHFTGHSAGREESVGLSLGDAASGDPILLTPDSLSGVQLQPGMLAFLAACSTFGEAPHSIEEPMALPASFLRAGAGDVIATRWAVDSAASRRLALAFYSEWLKGKPAAAALQIAQAQLRAQPEFSHPYYWAAYSLLER